MKQTAKATRKIINLQGYSITSWCSDIDFRFEQENTPSSYAPDEIDLKKVKKALTIFADCEHGFRIEVWGQGEKIEGYTADQTVFYNVKACPEDYKGVTLWSVDDYTPDKERTSKAYATFEEVCKVVMKEVEKVIKAKELEMNYIEKESK